MGLVQRRTAMEFARLRNVYAGMNIGDVLWSIREMPKLVRKPAYFADEAVERIVRTLGNDVEVDLTGGYAENGTPKLVKKIVSEFKRRGINARFNPLHVGGIAGRVLLVRPPESLSEKQGVQALKELFPKERLQKLFAACRHVNKPENASF